MAFKRPLHWHVTIGAAILLATLPFRAAIGSARPSLFEVVDAAGVQREARTSVPASDAPAARDVLSKYCFSCHNQKLLRGGLALDTANFDDVSSGGDVWEKVILKLRTRTMPPAGAPRPPQETYDAIAT